MFKWPLNINNFTFKDKLKIALFLLRNDRWTQGDQVEIFEKRFADYVGVNHAIFVSSGSTANTILAMYLKDKYFTYNKKKIIFPSTTWITSVSPFIREGFEPIFIDISLDDLALDLTDTEKYLQEHNDVLAIFPTSLLGFVPDIDRLKYLSDKYQVKVMMDNCENTFGRYKNHNVSSYFTSTTSTYFGHQLQSVEGGFIFTNDQEEYNYFKMYRNHGMVRSITNNKKYLNNLVDARFDFYLMGNNFRNTNINAYIGNIDFNKKDIYTKNRITLYKLYESLIDKNKYILPINYEYREHVPFSLPIICRNAYNKNNILNFCNQNKIETRPIISGNLIRQTCFNQYGIYTNYKNSELLNNNGLYVGLYSKLDNKLIIELTNFLNTL